MYNLGCGDLDLMGKNSNNQTGPMLLDSYPLTYINLHIKYGSNPINTIKILHYLLTDEVSVA